MKKSICLFLTVLLVFSALAAGSFSFAEEASSAAPYTLVTIEKGKFKNGIMSAGPDTSASVSGDVMSFRITGELDPQINIELDDPADTSVYPICAIKAKQSGSATLQGEFFYNEQGLGAVAGQEILVDWADTEDWQWVTADLSGCGSVGYIRFDLFNHGTVGCTGEIAALGFFKTAEEAEAFAASEAGQSLGTKHGNGQTDEPEPEEEYWYLYDPESELEKGWWITPYEEGKSISVYFESEVWFDGIWFFAYASPVRCPMRFSILDENDNEIYYKQIYATGNNENEIEFEKRFAPGVYTFCFETVELSPAKAANLHFVLGSADEGSVETSVAVMLALANEQTKDAPAIRLIKCEPDPDYTERPTATPRPTATESAALPTPIPTPVPPTQAPVTEVPTEAPKSEESSGSKAWIFIVVGAAAVIAAGVAVIILKKKKK